MKTLTQFYCHDLGGGCTLLVGRLPESLVLDSTSFEELWNLHPPERGEIRIHGRTVKTPRWQQAYGKDYRFAGATSTARPIPDILRPFLTWTTEAIDGRLNGILVNWYHGASGHYIGPHRDQARDLVPGTPIVTISFGENRIFRIRPWRQQGREPIDFPVSNGCVLVMSWETNQRFTHEVPASKRHIGRRISVTIRGFYQ